MARRGKVIDFKAWTAIGGVELTTSGNGTLAGGSFSSGIPITILRCRTPDILLSFDYSQQAGDDIQIALGLGIMSTDAFAAGAGSLPDPGSEPEYPWLWWGQYQLRSFAAANEQSLGTSVVRLSADTKAMRKMKPGQSLGWVVETSGASGSPTTYIEIATTRVLTGQ